MISLTFSAQETNNLVPTTTCTSSMNFWVQKNVRILWNKLDNFTVVRFVKSMFSMSGRTIGFYKRHTYVYDLSNTVNKANQCVFIQHCKGGCDEWKFLLHYATKLMSYVMTMRKFFPQKPSFFLIQHRKNGKCKHCHHHHYLTMRTGLFLNWFTSVKPDRQKDQQRICHFSL